MHYIKYSVHINKEHRVWQYRTSMTDWCIWHNLFGIISSSGYLVIIWPPNDRFKILFQTNYVKYTTGVTPVCHTCSVLSYSVFLVKLSKGLQLWFMYKVSDEYDSLHWLQVAAALALVIDIIFISPKLLWILWTVKHLFMARTEFHLDFFIPEVVHPVWLQVTSKTWDEINKSGVPWNCCLQI